MDLFLFLVVDLLIRVGERRGAHYVISRVKNKEPVREDFTWRKD